MSLERPFSRHESNPSEVRRYTLESGITIELTATVFRAGENRTEGRATIFLPGWAMESASKSAETISLAFSEHSGAETVSITTRAQERGTAQEPQDVLFEEARAIAQYIRERGIRDVVVAGHSQGGDKAVNVVSQLQQETDMRVGGLVLIDSVGLYERTPEDLAKSFIENSTVEHIRSVGKMFAHSPREGLEHIAPAVQAGNDIVAGVANEVRRSKLDYFARFKSEVEEMSHINPHLRDVSVPVVVVTGMSDSVSDVEHIAPSDAVIEAGADDSTLHAREAYLKEHILPNSPYIRMLVPEKLGVHSLPFLRPESVAKASLYMLERYGRERHDTFIKTE